VWALTPFREELLLSKSTYKTHMINAGNIHRGMGRDHALPAVHEAWGLEDETPEEFADIGMA